MSVSASVQRAESERAAKLQNALFVLRAFAAEHGGKLPSLRFMMKMLKVGFPKAHEIKKQYGEREGVTVRLIPFTLTLTRSLSLSALSLRNSVILYHSN